MNSIQLEIRHHQLLVAIAEEGSLTAATRRLHLTVSALSHQLRDAEERLGVALFQRRHKKLLLTAAGEQLLEASRILLRQAALAESAVRGQGQDLVRVSTGCYTAYAWLPAVLERFSSVHPDVEVRIVLEATRRPVEALLRGELDLALTSDAPRSGRLRSARLFSDELVLVVPAGHPLQRRGRVQAADLRGEHLITYDAPREDLDVFTALLWPAGVEPRRVSRVPLSEAMIELVRAGTGLAVMAGWSVPRDPALARLPLGLRRAWRAVTQRKIPAPLRDLVALLQQHAQRALPARGAA